MIVAVGLDLVDLDRVRRVLERYPERFLQRHFHPEEVAAMADRADPVPGLAARFAAKEAFQKCWPTPVGWRNVWVVKGGSGRPRLAVGTEVRERMLAEGLRAHLSLTHAPGHAAAVVVLEQLGLEHV